MADHHKSNAEVCGDSIPFQWRETSGHPPQARPFPQAGGRVAHRSAIRRGPIQVNPDNCDLDRISSAVRDYAWNQSRIERLFDLSLAMALIVLLAPLALLVILAVCVESPGGPIYTQTRVGLNGRRFKIFKIRTMRANAESAGPAWAAVNDMRVTRIGRFLRRTRIDEIPQLLNVLKGDMSLVGPRPERPEFVEMLRKEIRGYDLRHTVKPGLTGWAQINAPYASSIQEAKEKTSYDLFYVSNRSVLLYLRCILLTPRVVILGTGAR